MSRLCGPNMNLAFRAMTMLIAVVLVARGDGM